MDIEVSAMTALTISGIVYFIFMSWFVYSTEKTERIKSKTKYKKNYWESYARGVNPYHEDNIKELERKTIDDLQNQCQLCGSQRCHGALPTAKGCLLYGVLNKKLREAGRDES